MARSSSSRAEKDKRADSIQVIRRMASVLRRIGEAPEGLPMRDLLAAGGLPRSTVFRLVDALRQTGMVAEVSGERVLLVGPHLHRVCQRVLRALAADLHPFLVALADEVGETVDLSVLHGDQVLFVDQVVRHDRLQAVSGVGVLFPLHATANGKALLATLPEACVAELLPEELPAYTSQTLRRRSDLLRDLAEVRKSGVAYDREEHTLGISALGVAFVVGGRTYAVSIPVPTQRFAQREAAIRAALLAFRNRLSPALQVIEHG